MLPATGPPRTTRRPRPSRRPPRPRRRCAGRPARRPRARRRATPCRSESRTGSPELPSLSHVAPSGVAELAQRLIGSRQSPRPFPRRCAALEPRPLPSTGVTRLPGTAGLSATLTGPTLPSRAVGWRVPRHRQGFPCCAHSPLQRMPPPIPRRNRPVLASLASRPLAAFPVWQAGRLPHHRFRGLSAFTRVAACVVAEPPTAALFHRSASADYAELGIVGFMPSWGLCGVGPAGCASSVCETRSLRQLIGLRDSA